MIGGAGCFSARAVARESETLAPIAQETQVSTLGWRDLLTKKEGWIEGGVELLIMTSSLSTTFSDELVAIISPNPVALVDRRTDSTSPDYNLGFAVDFRYRAPTDNDLGFYYKYIHNDADGTLKRDVTSELNSAGSNERNIQNDSGHQHLHYHMVDFLFGRMFPLSPHSVMHVRGGLSFNDFHYYFRFKNDDDVADFAGGNLSSQVIIQLNAHQKGRLWGLGPKLELDFEYLFFPNRWKHDLNLIALVQFALLYSKEWSRGKADTLNIQQVVPNPPVTTANNIRWENHPKHSFVPNVNLDVGFKYRYHFDNGVILNFGGGYRIIAFWELEELARPFFYNGGTEPFASSVGQEFRDHFCFSGPYIRFSLAY